MVRRHRHPSTTATRNLAVSAAAFALISVAGSIGYVELFGWSVLDAVYMVVITVFTVGYGETRPLDAPALKIFTMLLIVLGSTALIFFTGSLVQFLTQGQIDRLLGARRMQADIAKLTGHTIICGYGRIGRTLAAELRRANMPFLVIDGEAARTTAAMEDGCLVLTGDATDEQVLETAGIARAKTLASVLPNDAANVFITLSARSLNPALYVIARGEAQSTEQKLLRAGADRVVMPTQIGAERIAHLILFPNARDLLTSPERAGNFAADLSELGIALHEVAVPQGSNWDGKRMSDVLGTRCLPVAIYRLGGAIESPPAPGAMLSGGDAVVLAVGRMDPVPAPPAPRGRRT